MRQHFKRGELLLEQGRWEQALESFQQHLLENPEDGHAFCLAARCYLGMELFGKASEYAAAAIAVTPDYSYAHYIQSYIFYSRHLYEESKKAVEVALELDPTNPDYFVQVARLRANDSDWLGTLDAADAALREAPNHADAQIIKSSALVKLRKMDEAGFVLQSVLETEPENDYALTELGFLHLHEGRWKDALEAFQSALLVDPESERARQGFMNALRAKFPLYGLILKYFFWVNSFSKHHQQAVVFGSAVVVRALEFARKEYPALAPLIGAILFLWRIFNYLAWTIQAATTLLLRCNKYGRGLVTRDEIVESNLVGGLWMGALLCFLYHSFVDPFTIFCRIGIPLFLTLPMVVGGAFAAPDYGWPKYLARAILVVMSVTGLAGLFLWTWSVPVGLHLLLFYFKTLGFVLLLLSYLEGVRPPRE